MKFIPLRVRAATIVHGYDDAHHEITESCECAEWQDKLLAIDRLHLREMFERPARVAVQKS